MTNKLTRIREEEYEDMQASYTPFQRWFLTFLEEKEVDLGEYITIGDGTTAQVGAVCSIIMSAPQKEQDKIEEMLVKIDYVNGNVTNYFKHLAKALSKKQIDEIVDHVF